MPTRKQVEEMARTLFPKGELGAILSVLDQYGVNDWERERERVQLAILKLSAGIEADVLKFTAVAKNDYRDVLMWADNPQSPEQTAKDRERAKEILRKWGK